MINQANNEICVFSDKEIAVEAMTSTDIVGKDVLTALELIQYPKRMVAH